MLQHQELNRNRFWIYVYSLCYLWVAKLPDDSTPIWVPLDRWASCSVIRFQSKERQKNTTKKQQKWSFCVNLNSLSKWCVFPLSLCFYLNGPVGACAEPWTWIRTCRSSTGACVGATAVSAVSSSGDCPHLPPPSLPPVSALQTHWWVHNRKPRRVTHRSSTCVRVTDTDADDILKMWPNRHAKTFHV